MMSLALRYHVHTRHIERHHHELWVWNGLYYGEESKGPPVLTKPPLGSVFVCYDRW
jgi:hypothetical protein